MKIPIQEHIEWLKNERTKYINKAYEESSERMLGFVYKMDDCIKHAESMLEKEKEVVCAAWIDGESGKNTDPKDYYNEIFNTNQENLPDSTNGYTYYPQENRTVFNTKEK